MSDCDRGSCPPSGDDEPCFSAIHSASEGRSRDVSLMGNAMVSAMCDAHPEGEELVEPEPVEVSPEEVGGSVNTSRTYPINGTPPHRQHARDHYYPSPVMQESTPAPRGQHSFRQIGALDSSTPSIDDVAECRSLGDGDVHYAQCYGDTTPLSHHNNNNQGQYDGIEPPNVMLPHEVADRRGLMRTITTLSTQVQRLTLQLRRAPPLSEDHIRSFDPLIADAHIRRLNDTLAQQSMLREMDRQRLKELEDRIANRAHLERDLEEKLHTFRERVLAQEARLDSAQAEIEEAAGLREEVNRLRSNEVRLNAELEELRYSDRDDDPDRITLVDTRRPRPSSAPSSSQGDGGAALERAFLEMDETASRQDLLLECVFEPMYVAFDAGITWCREVVRMQQASEELQVESAHDTTAQSEKDVLVAESEIESLKHQLIYAKMQSERADRALEHERKRNLLLAREHFERVEALAKQHSQSRQVMLNAVLPELQGRLMQAFRDGQRCRATVANDIPQVSKIIPTTSTQHPAGVVHTPRDVHGAKKYRKTAGSAPSTPRAGGAQPGSTHATQQLAQSVSLSSSTKAIDDVGGSMCTDELNAVHTQPPKPTTKGGTIPNDSVEEGGLTIDRSKTGPTHHDSSLDDREMSIAVRNHLIEGDHTPPRRLDMH